MKTMKTIKMILLAFVLLATACTQNSTTPTTVPTQPQTGWKVDSTYWFKITFNGKTLNYFGSGQYNNGTYSLVNYPSFYNVNNSGFADLEIANGGLSQNAFITHTEVFPTLYFKKLNTNGWIGSYVGVNEYIFSSNQPLCSGKINDLTTSTIYYIDSTATANITASDAVSFSGSFTCTLQNGNTFYPATGSFKIKK